MSTVVNNTRLRFFVFLLRGYGIHVCPMATCTSFEVATDGRGGGNNPWDGQDREGGNGRGWRHYYALGLIIRTRSLHGQLKSMTYTVTCAGSRVSSSSSSNLCGCSNFLAQEETSAIV